jgi:type IV secretory pathway VirB3-like protein
MIDRTRHPLTRLAVYLAVPFGLLALLVLVFGGLNLWASALGLAFLGAAIFTGLRVLAYVDSEIKARKRARGIEPD